MRLLIECTYVYDQPRDHSGVQRVVRNVVAHLGNTDKIAPAIPVMLKNNCIYEVKRLSPDHFIMYILNRIQARLVRVRERSWLYYPQIKKRPLFCSSRNMRRGLLALYKTGDIFFRISIAFISRLCRCGEINKRIVDLTAQPDDVLVLLDSSWHSDSFAQIEKLKAQGVTIISVIYDLIPLTHPRFCDARLVMVFKHWLKWISRTADGFIAISKTSRDQVQDYVCRMNASNHQWFDYFQLGSNPDLSPQKGAIREKIRQSFENDHPVYLMVGTIEPRKNHAYLLDAFEYLWRLGVNVRLCIVGKVGWKCRALVGRIQKHAEYNRRLFMFNDVNDTELEYCYHKSRSLVLPAYAEGFGLPLVEAMQRGLPAMASDIPVFREVGGDFIAYFNPDKPDTLAALIRRYEETGNFPAIQKLADWSWPNWENSTRQLLEKIVSHTKKSSAPADALVC